MSFCPPGVHVQLLNLFPKLTHRKAQILQQLEPRRQPLVHILMYSIKLRTTRIIKTNIQKVSKVTMVIYFPGEWLLCPSRVIRVWSQRILHQKWTSWRTIHKQEGTEQVTDHYSYTIVAVAFAEATFSCSKNVFVLESTVWWQRHNPRHCQRSCRWLGPHGNYTGASVRK